MLTVGSIAPDINEVTTQGVPFVLSEQRGICTVLYFFPRAFTPGCTAQTKRFRDNHVELTLSRATVVGVSTDDGSTQCRFAQEVRSPFPLIADDERHIGRAYEVLWPLIGLAKRVTYVIDAERCIIATFRNELRIQQHCDNVLRFVHDYAETVRNKELAPASQRFQDLVRRAR